MHTVTNVIYTLSLHDALPICDHDEDREAELHLVRRTGVLNLDFVRHINPWQARRESNPQPAVLETAGWGFEDRKSTRLNSSHEWISYAVFCLKKKKENDGDGG